MSPLPVRQLAFHSGGARPVRRPSLLGAHPLHRQQSGQQAHLSPAGFQGFRKRDRFVAGGNSNELETPDASQGFRKRHRFVERPDLGAPPAPYREPSLSAPARSQGSSKHSGSQLSGRGSQAELEQMSAGPPAQQLPPSAPGASQGSQGFSKRNRFVRSASSSQPEPENPSAGLPRRPVSAPALAAQKTSMRPHSNEPLHHSSAASPEGRAAGTSSSLAGDQSMPCKAQRSAHAPAPAAAHDAQQAATLPTAYTKHCQVMGPVPEELKEQQSLDHSLPGHSMRPLHQASMQQAAPGPAFEHQSSSMAIFPGHSNDKPQQHAVPTTQAHQQHSSLKEAFREAQQMQPPGIPGPKVSGNGQDSAHSEAAGVDSDIDSDADMPAEDVTLLSKPISPAFNASRGESGSRWGIPHEEAWQRSAWHRC